MVSLVFSLAAVSVQSALAWWTCTDPYTVQRGDYLASIARNCGTSVQALLAANPTIRNPNLIFPGQVLRLGLTATPAVTITGTLLTTPATATVTGTPGTLTPTSGTATGGVPVTGGGTSTPVPTLTRTATPSAGRVTHTYIVQSGDTLWSIARSWGVSLADLERANRQITNPALIFPGQVITIP
jgi:spore coat assembly protein SafA